jgi:hypothetical protein
MHMTGCARVHSSNDMEGSGFVLFCTCSAEGRTVWNELQAFHDYEWECTRKTDCIHTQTLEAICRSDGYSQMMLCGRSLGELIPFPPFGCRAGPAMTAHICRSDAHRCPPCDLSLRLMYVQNVHPACLALTRWSPLALIG